MNEEYEFFFLMHYFAWTYEQVVSLPDWMRKWIVNSTFR